MAEEIDITEGRQLGLVVKELTQAKIDRYATVSGDLNPLHIDPEFAADTFFKGTIAHGMLGLSSLSELMEGEFGGRWLASGSLKVRFRGAARPGDRLTTSGQVSRIRDGRAFCHLECQNQNSEVLISGEASVAI